LQTGKVGGPGLETLEVPREFWKWPGSPRDPAQGDPLVTFRYDQVWEFVDAIRNRRPCNPSLHDGARTQAVMDAAVKSAETRQWVELGGSPA
jgi:predicted dehydrogenase